MKLCDDDILSYGVWLNRVVPRVNGSFPHRGCRSRQMSPRWSQKLTETSLIEAGPGKGTGAQSPIVKVIDPIPKGGSRVLANALQTVAPDTRKQSEGKPIEISGPSSLSGENAETKLQMYSAERSSVATASRKS